MVETKARGLRKHEPSGATEKLTSAFKERVYATFTSPSVLGAILAAGHATARDALLELSVAIFAIPIAGFLAEVIAHEVSHNGGQRLGVSAPWHGSRSERWGRHRWHRMVRASAILVLLFATLGVIGLNLAPWIGVITYAVTLVLIILLARRHVGLRGFQRLASSAMLLLVVLITNGTSPVVGLT